MQETDAALRMSHDSISFEVQKSTYLPLETMYSFHITIIQNIRTEGSN